MDGDLVAGPTRISRWIGLLMVAEAATFAIASAIHFDITLPLGFATLHGEAFTGAAIPEAIIAGVLLGGAIGTLASPRGSWGLVLATVLFAIGGVIVGLNFVLPQARLRPGDAIYHVVILIALLITLAIVITPGARKALRR